MRMNALVVALLASFFLFTGAAQAQTQELPPFDAVDQDGDGTISQEEAAMYPEIQERMEGEEMSEEEYEEMREEMK